MTLQDDYSHAKLAGDYLSVRQQTESLASPLSAEDMQIQSMTDASPTKWHLAHTSWFFETFILTKYAKTYQAFDSNFGYLFNSYYHGVGKQFARHHRGLITRPNIDQVKDYRHHVDHQMLQLIESADMKLLAQIAPLIQLGVNHEQQHQELLLTDIKHAFYQNPTFPAYSTKSQSGASSAKQSLAFNKFGNGLISIGQTNSQSNFHFDNETPQHQQYIQDFELANRLVNNDEYLQFINDGGYHNPNLWLDEGWYWLQQNAHHKPYYWVHQNDQWYEFTLTGLAPLDPLAPVTHLNYFEAYAFATWMQCRLPTEFEWEYAASQQAVTGSFQETGNLHPFANDSGQLFGECWQWTSSSYAPYPGFKTPEGAIGEYNGKFMCNQYVLRGGSCVTPRSHFRLTYRNFFPTHAAWQFTGLRLAKDV